MFKKFLTICFAFTLTITLMASEHGHGHSNEHSSNNFYVIGKIMSITGDDVSHGHAILEGDSGNGFGLDFGYKFNHNFAVEFDFSSSSNDVKEIVEEGHESLFGETAYEKAKANYYSYALFLVYTHHLSDKVGVFLKGGYEHEIEKIDDFHIDSSDNGFAYGVGIEFLLKENTAFLVEYESSTIEGPKGSSIFAGIAYSF